MEQGHIVFTLNDYTTITRSECDLMINELGVFCSANEV